MEVLIWSLSSGFRITHPSDEAHTAHRVQELGGAIAFDFFAQVTDVDIKGVWVADEGFPPHCIQDARSLKHPPAVFEQVVKQREFALG